MSSRVPVAERGQLIPWEEEVREGDLIIQDPRPDDIIILLMGPTGVGKSSFINGFFEEGVARVEPRSMLSCTSKMEAFIRALDTDTQSGRRLILVDTPGFNDTFQHESETLRHIAVGLASIYRHGLRVAGIVYLNDISQKRMTGTLRFNFRLFQEICGKQADLTDTTIIMATTFWDWAMEAKDREDVALSHESEYRDNFWRPILEEQRATLERVVDYSKCPRRIVSSILQRVGQNPIHMQKELEEERKRIAETDAGQELQLWYNVPQWRKYNRGLPTNIARSLEGSDPGMGRQSRDKARECVDPEIEADRTEAAENAHPDLEAESPTKASFRRGILQKLGMGRNADKNW